MALFSFVYNTKNSGLLTKKPLATPVC